MAEVKHQQGYPLAPATTVPRSDVESTTNDQTQQQMKKKKRMKCLAWIGVFLVLQTIVIVVLALVVGRVQTPRVRLQDVSVTNHGNGNITFSGRVSIRNRNFGRYRFESSVAVIRSGEGGTVIGQFAILEGRVGMRSTRRVNVDTDLISMNANSGMLPATIDAQLRGRVEFLNVLKRRRAANLRCTMNINTSTYVVQDLWCN